jgi:hypothetical protein
LNAQQKWGDIRFLIQLSYKANVNAQMCAQKCRTEKLSAMIIVVLAPPNGQSMI